MKAWIAVGLAIGVSITLMSLIGLSLPPVAVTPNTGMASSLDTQNDKLAFTPLQMLTTDEMRAQAWAIAQARFFSIPENAALVATPALGASFDLALQQVVNENHAGASYYALLRTTSDRLSVKPQSTTSSGLFDDVLRASQHVATATDTHVDPVKPNFFDQADDKPNTGNVFDQFDPPKPIAPPPPDKYIGFADRRWWGSCPRGYVDHPADPEQCILPILAARALARAGRDSTSSDAGAATVRAIRDEAEETRDLMEQQARDAEAEERSRQLSEDFRRR